MAASKIELKISVKENQRIFCVFVNIKHGFEMGKC